MGRRAQGTTNNAMSNLNLQHEILIFVHNKNIIVKTEGAKISMLLFFGSKQTKKQKFAFSFLSFVGVWP